ncbi:MAG TPA: bifunctional phosphopantothenoylcysteine decarboxylase/phosphopantothenate--cysteine ligase CoaBC [Acidimicrobiales bacterium]
MSADPRPPARPLDGRFVVLGVTGGIAAYKAVELCRLLVDAGAHVAPVLTKAATEFVGVATFSALASEPAQTEIFGAASPIPHTRLGQAADLVIVAPATARSIAAYAAGLSDELLGATLLATTAPVLVCPAMHTEMWHHASVQENLATLRRRGVAIVEPESGRLAGGDVGEGRLADLHRILESAEALLSRRSDLEGKSVVVTAGGTREPIDPVRYISNRSSGKQGIALAAQAARRGASVTLISSVAIEPPPGVVLVEFETTDELQRAVLAHGADADVVIMAAAVADFRPVVVAREKLKRRSGIPELRLEATPDVLAALVASRRPGQVIVGFAAETTDAIENATGKLHSKALDLIVVNDVSQPGVGFGYDTNAVTILFADGGRKDVALAAKSEIADSVLDACVGQLAAHPSK